MTTHCERCGKPLEPGFRMGRRKYHVHCRNLIAHELNVRKCRRDGYRPERKRPFWVWFAEMLREDSKAARVHDRFDLVPCQVNVCAKVQRKYRYIQRIEVGVTALPEAGNSGTTI